MLMKGELPVESAGGVMGQGVTGTLLSDVAWCAPMTFKHGHG